MSSGDHQGATEEFLDMCRELFNSRCQPQISLCHLSSAILLLSVKHAHVLLKQGFFCCEKLSTWNQHTLLRRHYWCLKNQNIENCSDLENFWLGVIRKLSCGLLYYQHFHNKYFWGTRLAPSSLVCWTFVLVQTVALWPMNICCWSKLVGEMDLYTIVSPLLSMNY